MTTPTCWGRAASVSSTNAAKWRSIAPLPSRSSARPTDRCPSRPSSASAPPSVNSTDRLPHRQDCPARPARASPPRDVLTPPVGHGAYRPRARARRRAGLTRIRLQRRPAHARPLLECRNQCRESSMVNRSPTPAPAVVVGMAALWAATFAALVLLNDDLRAFWSVLLGMSLVGSALTLLSRPQQAAGRRPTNRPVRPATSGPVDARPTVPVAQAWQEPRPSSPRRCRSCDLPE